MVWAIPLVLAAVTSPTSRSRSDDVSVLTIVLLLTWVESQSTDGLLELGLQCGSDLHFCSTACRRCCFWRGKDVQAGGVLTDFRVRC